MDNRNPFESVKYLVYITQFGLSLVLPVLLCLLGAKWLQGQFGAGGWIYAVGLAVGLLAAAGSLGAYFRFVQRETKKAEEAHRKL